MSPPSLLEPTTNNQPTSSAGRILLVGLALILLGILLGVLAARFLPMSSNALIPLPPITLTPTVFEPIITPTTEITPIPTPTATPSALLNLKWNMMTVKSPVSFDSSYRISYPSTWTIKEYKNTPTTKVNGYSSLILSKGNTSLNIIQGAGDSTVCLFPEDPDRQDAATTRYSSYYDFSHGESPVWRLGITMEGDLTMGDVCEKKTSGGFDSFTALGLIKLAKVADTATLDEARYILEKIIIVK